MSVDRIETGRAAPFTGRIRMADLARLAGVSVATVSRSLSDSNLINRVTKRRVWQIASDHGYVAARDMPEALHGSLATLALMVPAAGPLRFFDPFMQDLLAGIAEAAREARCDLMISHLGPHGQRDLAGAMQGLNADAFLFLGRKGIEEALASAGELTRRFVVWGDPQPDAGYCTVGPDNFAIGHAATKHLLESGCRRIAYLGDNDGPEMTRRFRGYLAALSEAGLSLDPALLLPEGWARSPVAFDGLFAAGEGALPAVAQTLHALGADVKLAGYHNGRLPFARVSAVAMDMGDAGRAVIARLLGAASDIPQEPQLLPVKLSIDSL